MIYEREYGYWYWLSIELDEQAFLSFIDNIEKINTEHGIHLIDGIDITDKRICFAFTRCKPTKRQEIKWAKKVNESHCKQFLQLLSKKIDGKLYFNVNHNRIKKNG